MGSIFMYVVKGKPMYNWGYNEIAVRIIKQGSASVLDHIIQKLPKTHRPKFPILSLLNDYKSYNDEKLILNEKQVTKLKFEIDQIEDILLKRKFLSGINADQIIQHLSTDFPPISESEVFEKLNKAKELIYLAFENESCIYIER